MDADDKHTLLDPTDMSQWFWDTIDYARENPSELHTILNDTSDAQLRQFALEFYDAASRLQAEPFTDYIAPGTSEDGIEHISWRVVSKGKEFYSNVWFHPETMPQSMKAIDSPSFYAVAQDILDKRLGEWPDVWEEFEDYLSSSYHRVSDYLAAKGENNNS